MNSRLIEKKVEYFLESIFKPENSSNKRLLQKKKFVLLSKLVADLFNCKNSNICFNNISNLIILILSLYNEKYAIDIHSSIKGNHFKESDPDYKRILKEEFQID